VAISRPEIDHSEFDDKNPVRVYRTAEDEESRLLVIPGVRVPGQGMAHHNLATQLPLIAVEFPELAGCHAGTINLELQFPLVVIAPDHRTRPIHWDDKHFQNGEVFDFLRIQFEASGTKPVDAWLYIPHASPHRSTPRVHEVIAPQLLAIPAGAQCIVRIDRNAAQLPYPSFPAAIVL
jgi:hypothetical protein